MKWHDQRLIFPLFLLTASLILDRATCNAQLLPPGDFQGKSLDEWTLDWSQWAIATGLGEQTLPDIVDGVRYLPPNFGGGDFVADLTIPQEPLLVSPFFVFGERYDNGTEDNPNDPVLDAIFDDATIKTTFDGTVLLEGAASSFPDRLTDVTVFSQPIPYAEPQPRGPGVNAVAALFAVGIGTMYDNLPFGEHTIQNVYTSPNFFGGPYSFTYNITVVPEPACLLSVGVGTLGLFGCGRRRRSKDII
jgi:hypothetical protein